MLSYRHAFHAGNHADVLKHFVLMLVLRHAAQKDKPFWYIDTHAGAGMYALDNTFAMQNAEFNSGISRLWDAPDMPEALADYVKLVKKLNPTGQLRRYPGSPVIAHELLRRNDRMRLFELHPNDSKLLRQTFLAADGSAFSKKAMIETADGFAGIKAQLPPPPRRAVVLIDPPYEQKQNYQRVVESIKDSLQRFPTGTYMVWYPLLQRREPQQMLDKLQKMELDSWLHVALKVQAPSPDGFGMQGSGLFIINPPWILPKLLADTMPYLVEKLGQDDDAEFGLDSQIP